jgi:hypothetical protein
VFFHLTKKRDFFFFSYQGENSMPVCQRDYVEVEKKGFENTLFEIRVVVKYPPCRTNIYIYNKNFMQFLHKSMTSKWNLYAFFPRLFL